MGAATRFRLWREIVKRRDSALRGWHDGPSMGTGSGAGKASRHLRGGVPRSCVLRSPSAPRASPPTIIARPKAFVGPTGSPSMKAENTTHATGTPTMPSEVVTAHSDLGRGVTAPQQPH